MRRRPWSSGFEVWGGLEVEFGERVRFRGEKGFFGLGDDSISNCWVLVWYWEVTTRRWVLW